MGAPSHFLLDISEILLFVINSISSTSFCLFLLLVKLIKIHSPMRADPNRVIKWVPSQGRIRAARIASEKLLR